MKKNTLLHSELSYLMSKLGHTDEITIADAGLPIPNDVARIDLALTHNVPGFIQTVQVLLQESQIESVIIAEEMRTQSPILHKELLAALRVDSEQTGRETKVDYLCHEDFKLRTGRSKAIVRTGECTPYANVIFQMGVTF